MMYNLYYLFKFVKYYDDVSLEKSCLKIDHSRFLNNASCIVKKKKK